MSSEVNLVCDAVIVRKSYAVPEPLSETSKRVVACAFSLAPCAKVVRLTADIPCPLRTPSPVGLRRMSARSSVGGMASRKGRMMREVYILNLVCLVRRWQVSL